MNEEALFHEARQKPAHERPVFLREACGGDVALSQRVEVLLHAHDNPDSLLQPKSPAPPAPTNASTFVTPLSAEPLGTMIGPYKLREVLGEGGMGIVYVADQEKPVRRRVALKVIKAGMDTREVISRFEAERQALALMDHPNIARVLDAGTTEEVRNAECGMRNKEVRNAEFGMRKKESYDPSIPKSAPSEIGQGRNLPPAVPTS